MSTANANAVVNAATEAEAAQHQQPQPKSRLQQACAPSAREFYTGLAVLTALAAVSMMRGGTPGHALADTQVSYAAGAWDSYQERVLETGAPIDTLQSDTVTVR